MRKVLVVEDDFGISRLLYDGLTEHGFQVHVAADGQLGLDLALKEKFDLLILDVMLPTKNGFEISTALRNAKVVTPILMLTARDEIDDRVKGLELGADDYLPKPFDFRELLARVDSLLRRDRIHRQVRIIIQDLVIDTSTQTVQRAGKEIVLGHREFELLHALASQHGRVLTREVIQERIWGNSDRFSNMVDVTIGTLRKKIDDGFGTKLIQTVRSVGYVLKEKEG